MIFEFSRSTSNADEGLNFFLLKVNPVIPAFLNCPKFICNHVEVTISIKASFFARRSVSQTYWKSSLRFSALSTNFLNKCKTSALLTLFKKVSLTTLNLFFESFVSKAFTRNVLFAPCPCSPFFCFCIFPRLLLFSFSKHKTFKKSKLYLFKGTFFCEYSKIHTGTRRLYPD